MENFIKKAETDEEAQRISQEQIKQLEEQIKLNEYKAKLEEEKQSKRETFRENTNPDIGDSNMFLVLIQYNEASYQEDHDAKDWEICTSRKEAYEYIKANLEVANLLESQVISETLPFTDSISAGAFICYCLDSGKIEDEGFDPRDGEHLPVDFDPEEDLGEDE